MTTVFHIGFRKTATSTLQRHVFPTLDGWAYLGHGSRFFGELNPLIRDLLWTDEPEYDDRPLRALLERARRGCAGVVLSTEHLSTFHRRGRPARRLHAIDPDAKIIVCVRNQESMLRSAYSQHVRNGGTHRFAEWADEVRDNVWLHFDVVVECYQELFGRDAVFVAPYELLVADQRRFLTELYAFIAPGAEPPSWPTLRSENVSLSPAALEFLRCANRAVAPFERFPRKRVLVRAAAALDRAVFTHRSRVLPRQDVAVIECLLSRYATGNIRLEQLTGLDLGQYGYPLTDDPSSTAREVTHRSVFR